MALPIVAGIVPILLSISKVLFAYRLLRIIYVVSIRLLILAALVAMFLLVLAAIQAALNGLSVAMPDMLQQAFSMFLPSNFAACISAIITCQVLIFVWHWKKYAVEHIAQGVQ